MHRNGIGRKGFSIAGILALSLAQPAAHSVEYAPASAGQADLVVHATGFGSNQGHAVADLFVEGEDILGKPHIRIEGDIKGGQATLTFPNLKYREYAVRVFHDENGNGKLDHNFMSIPSEPLGFSNGFSLGLTSGLPTFEKLRFSFVSGARPLEIVVK